MECGIKKETAEAAVKFRDAYFKDQFLDIFNLNPMTPYIKQAVLLKSKVR